MFMLILVMMLLIGLCACVWGFMMCFLPAKWDRLTEEISFAGRWTEPSPKRLHLVMRIGNQIAGLVIFAVGCWFAYVAASKIHLVLSGQAIAHTVPPASGTLTNSPTPILTVFSLLMAIIGAIMVSIPRRVVTVFERVWPTGRSVKSSAISTLTLFVRVLGAALTLLAIMSLVH
jgi:hypothetical protein